MCIENERKFKGKRSEVRWVWKVFDVKGKTLFPVCVWHQSQREGFELGVWQKAISKASKNDSRYSPGYHAYGSREQARNYANSDWIDESERAIRCKVRGIIATNANGDVRAEWLFIPKKEAEKALRGK